MPRTTVEQDVTVNPGRTTTLEVRVRPLAGILGTVEEAPSGDLLQGVRVRLVDGSGRVVAEAATGDDGGCAFNRLAGGTYTVRVVPPTGFAAQGGEAQALDVAPGAEARFAFRLFRYGTVEGRVVSEEGAPWADAEVSLLDTAGTAVRTARTDADGRYAFSSVPVDRYRLRVTTG